jgi:hypothetical protein
MAGFEEIVSRWWEFIRRTPTRMAAIVTLSLVGIVSICALTVSRGHDQREYLFNSHEFNPSELAAAEVAFARPSCGTMKLSRERLPFREPAEASTSRPCQNPIRYRSISMNRKMKMNSAD